jgi:hypothetical protein
MVFNRINDKYIYIYFNYYIYLIYETKDKNIAR